MKLNRLVWSAVCSLAGSVSLACALLLWPSPAKAATVAYWRFEEGLADTQMAHVSGTNGVWSADVPDSSGNGNALSVWTGEAWAGYVYKSDVPAPTIPQTGAVNALSVKNSGGSPAMWNNTLSTWTPAQWTIEATFKPENGGYRTLVGRDSRGATTNDANLAAMYFQLIPGNAVAIKYADVAGVWHEAISAAAVVQGFTFSTDPDGLTGRWYAMAAVSDGKKLSLYLNDIAAGTGYQLVAQTDLTASGSANTALTPGTGDGGDWDAGNFTVGRGLYNGGHGDRAYGFIDEVRLSDTALAPNQLLFANPSEVEVRGTITDTLTGAPVEGATVTVGTKSTLTDSAGKYSVFTTPGATFPITVSSPYGEATYTSTVTVPTSGVVTKDAAIPVRPHLTLSSGLGYAWKVLGNTGSEADYSAVNADEASFQPITVPGDWNGTVGTTDDIYGWYRLHLTVPASFTSVLPGRMIRFRVGPVQAIDDIDATYVNGHLIGTTGHFPTVKLDPQPTGHTNPPITDAPVVQYPGQDVAYNHERVYVFPASFLKPGQDNVIAIKVFDMTFGGGLIGAPLLEVMPPTGVVTGTVKVGGSGVEGVRVSSMDAAGISNGWTFTDANGQYTLTHATPGESIIGMAKLGLEPKAAQVTVPSGGTLTVNFTTAAVTDGGPAPMYDDFNYTLDGWTAMWTAIALEPNQPEYAPIVTAPGMDFNTFSTIDSSISIESVTGGNRGGILSKDRISRYASVNSAKLVSAITAVPEPTGGDPNVILRLIGDAQDDPAQLTAASRWYENDMEGYLTLDEGNGITSQRVQLRLWSQLRGNTGNRPVPFPIQRMGDLSPTNPLILTIVRTGSVYDTYLGNNPDGITGSVLMHTDVIPDPGMLDHKVFLYSYFVDGKSTWDWVRAAGATPVQPPVPLAVRALRVAGGLDAAPTPAGSADFNALNAASSGNSSGKIDIFDAVTLARQGL